MTPAQQTALEDVCGQSLTPEQVTAIDAYLPDRNDVEIAKLLPPKAEVVTTEIGIGTILAVMAPGGGDFLNALEAMSATDANVKWTLKLIERGSFDVGHPVTRVQLAQFATDYPAMAAGINALLAVAVRSTPIHYNTVSDALNVAEGRLTLG